MHDTRKTITRNTTCGSLKLPVILACEYCKPSIIKALSKGIAPKIIKKCRQPFASKWSRHRELTKVRLYKDIHNYLGNVDIEGDILVNTRNYNNKKKISRGGKENIITLEKVNQSTLEKIGKSTFPTIPLKNNSALEQMSGNDSSNKLYSEEIVRNTTVEKENNENKENEIVTIDCNHTVVHKAKLSILQRKADQFNRIMKQLSMPFYQGTPLGDSMLGFASSLVPQCGHAGIATILPLAIGSVLTNAGIDINSRELVASQPSGQSIQRFVEQNAANTLLLIQESLKNVSSIFISADKGNKKGNKNLAKFVCWYSIIEKCVKVFLLDVDCTDEATNEIADALEHSIRRLVPMGTKVLGQCTDSGGGGTKYALFRALANKNLTWNNYLVCTCYLHNLQTSSRNAVVNVLGEGGTNEKGEPVMNLMQMLHGAYKFKIGKKMKN
mgnify:FL=1